MNILILGNIPPGVTGGAEIQSLRLAQCWAAAGHHITIAGPDNTPNEALNISVLRTPLLRYNKSLRGLSYTTSILLLLWSRRREFDLIYCRFLKEQALVAALAKLLFRLHQPLISCPASWGTSGDIAWIQNSMFRGFLLWLFDNNISCINAMSKKIMNEVRLIGFHSPLLTTIPNGVSIPFFYNQRNLDSQILRIIFVGRLVKEKGLDLFLKAISLQKQDNTTFEVVIIGDGPLRHDLEQRRDALGLTRIVHFRGAVPHEQIPEQLAQADLFVLPSRYEGMPGALLEAIAQCLPIIATRCGGAEEIVDDSIGWVVPTENAKALARAITCARKAGKETLREMGVNAYMKATHKYEISNLANKHLDIFNELITSGLSKSTR